MILTNINGVDLYYIHVDKFCQSKFGVYIITETSMDLLKTNSILLNLVSKRCKSYPTNFEYQKHLEDLYSASINYITANYGNAFFTNIVANFINDQYVLDDTEIFKEIVKIFNELLNDQVFYVDGQFDEELINKEKELHKANIDEISNIDYLNGLFNIIDNIYDDEFEKIRYNRDKKLIDEISNQSLLDSFNKIKNSKKVFYYIGNYSLEKVTSIVKENLHVTSIDQFTPVLERNVYRKGNDILNNVITKDNKQSLVYLAYKSNFTNYIKDLSFRLLANIFNELIGGRMSSDFFQIVREKYKLAYDIQVIPLNSGTGMIVYAGVDAKNIEKTKDLIMSIIKNYQDGKFTKEHQESFDKIKETLITSINTKYESINAYDSLIEYQVIRKLDYDKEKEIQMVKDFTLDDIAKYARNLILDQFYVIKGEQNNDSKE